ASDLEGRRAPGRSPSSEGERLDLPLYPPQRHPPVLLPAERDRGLRLACPPVEVPPAQAPSRASEEEAPQRDDPHRRHDLLLRSATGEQSEEPPRTGAAATEEPRQHSLLPVFGWPADCCRRRDCARSTGGVPARAADRPARTASRRRDAPPRGGARSGAG